MSMIVTESSITMDIEGTPYRAKLLVGDSNEDFCRIVVRMKNCSGNEEFKNCRWDYVYEYNTGVIWSNFYYAYGGDRAWSGRPRSIFIGNDKMGYGCYGLERLEEAEDGKFFIDNILPLIRPMLKDFLGEWLLL